MSIETKTTRRDYFLSFSMAPFSTVIFRYICCSSNYTNRFALYFQVIFFVSGGKALAQFANNQKKYRKNYNCILFVLQIDEYWIYVICHNRIPKSVFEEDKIIHYSLLLATLKIDFLEMISLLKLILNWFINEFEINETTICIIRTRMRNRAKI